jgi:hypothetical protein
MFVEGDYSVIARGAIQYVEAHIDEFEVYFDGSEYKRIFNMIDHALVDIIESTNTSTKPQYKFKATCLCGWQCQCGSEDAARRALHNHILAQAELSGKGGISQGHV